MEEATKYKKQGYTGLVNLGNTCFLNACVQVLKHTTELNTVLDVIQQKKKNAKKNIDDTIILQEWEDLRSVLLNNNGTVSPNRFVENVHIIAKKKQRDIFTGWSQNDMPEFLLFIIDCLHNSISRKVNIKISGNIENKVDELAIKCYSKMKEIYAKEYSEIMELFYGMYVSTLASVDNSVIHSISPEMFFILDLPIPPHNQQSNITLLDCFDLFTHIEMMENENAWFNEKTNEKEAVKKQLTFWNLPTILIITLKRFTMDGSNKINDLIHFPIDELDLSKYISGYNAETYIYELYGVCNHFGNVFMGHYTAFVKNEHKEWLHYNDANIEIISNAQNIITPMAYCLFYKKK